MVVARPENVLISRYGPSIDYVLEADGRFLRLENQNGWIKWIQRDSFLRRLRAGRMTPSGPSSISKFLEIYGERALEAVKEDTRDFRVDSAADEIHLAPIDPLREVSAITYDHYLSEMEKGHPFEVLVEQKSELRRTFLVQIMADKEDLGRFVGSGGAKIQNLTKRIKDETGVNVDAFVRRRPGSEGKSGLETAVSNRQKVD